MTLVRPAIQSDFPSWAQMRFQLWPSASVQEHLAELHNSLGQSSFQAWVAIKGERYLGFAEASIRPYANGCESSPVAFLEGIWVDESHRKEGLGRQIVEVVECWAREKGIYELGSDSELENTQSHLCHNKWGFEETERVIYFRKKLST